MAKHATVIGSIVLVTALASAIASRAGAVEAQTNACPRLAEAQRLPLRPGGSPLRADIDGDDRLDRITVRYAPRARASCGFVLVVRTATRVFSVRLPEWYKPPQDLSIRDWPFPEPYLAAAVKLDPVRSQIVVARWHGAAVAVVSLYGLAGGELVQLRFQPHTYPSQLPLFGTVGTGSTTARCIAGGPLIMLSIWPNDSNGTRWSIRRTEFRLAAREFRRIWAHTVEGTSRKVDALARQWGMDAAPFTGCVVARGRRL